MGSRYSHKTKALSTTRPLPTGNLQSLAHFDLAIIRENVNNSGVFSELYKAFFYW